MYIWLWSLSDHMLKELLNYMENDGTIPKREVVTLSDPEDNALEEVQCPNPKESFSKLKK